MGSRGLGFILRMVGSRVFNAENDLKRGEGEEQVTGRRQ